MLKNKNLNFAKFHKTNEKLPKFKQFLKKNLNVMMLYNQDMICCNHYTFPAKFVFINKNQFIVPLKSQ